MPHLYWVSILLGCLAASAHAERPSALPATLQVITVPGRPGETCVILLDAKKVPLMRRCTYRYLSG
jgi:hypothetical protein